MHVSLIDCSISSQAQPSHRTEQSKPRAPPQTILVYSITDHFFARPHLQQFFWIDFNLLSIEINLLSIDFNLLLIN